MTLQGIIIHQYDWLIKPRFHRWWPRRSNYGITEHNNPPVQLVGQTQIPPNLSPAYTISSSSVSGVSLDDK